MNLDWSKARRSAWLTDALRAFCVAMWIVVLVAAGAAFNQISQAHADSPICEHRGEAHAAQQHTTREADSRWHVEHGQLPTCDLDKKDDRDHNAGRDEHDSDLPGHRDHPGYHCVHFTHCG